MLHPFDPAAPTGFPKPAHLAAAGFEPGHVLQFYESESFLTALIVDFVAAGLVSGQPAVVIATEARRQAITAALRQRWLDVDALLAAGQLTMVDADETLTAFMTGGAPDPELFKLVVGRVLAKGQRQGRRPCSRVYSEMVDILWKEGNAQGATQVEKLWNQLATDHAFALLCAYTLEDFRKADGAHFQNVCAEHGCGVPGESYAETDADGRFREIAQLQQRARSLEVEMHYRQQLEEALRETLARQESARADAERANRIRDDFLAILSHELRTPLNAILGWTQIMQSGSTDAATMSRGLDVITRNAELQTHLIQDLLDVSRIIRGQLEIGSDAVDLGEAVRAAAESVRPSAAAKDIELELRIEPSVMLVTGDARRLHQIVWHLLTNAVKFTPSNGRVSLSLDRVDGEARLVVADTGQGIAPDFLPYIFERFRQADKTTTRRYGGLGLGLAVVRHLAEAHGGGVSAHSDGDGRGATFVVSLPERTVQDQGDALEQPVLVNSDAGQKSRRA